MTKQNSQMTMSDIAEEWGVTRQRVHQLLASPDFPEPTFATPRVRLWRREDIQKWGLKHGYLREY